MGLDGCAPWWPFNASTRQHLRTRLGTLLQGDWVTVAAGGNGLTTAHVATERRCLPGDWFLVVLDFYRDRLDRANAQAELLTSALMLQLETGHIEATQCDPQAPPQ